MNKNIIYHNPRCQKSRAALQLLREKGAEVKIIEYLKHPPGIAELAAICKGLAIKPRELMRTKEKRYRELGLSSADQFSEKEWLKILHENPVLIERPIVIYKKKVALGRPPEDILKIL